MTIPNVPVPDELAAVRDEIKRLGTREAQLKEILLTDSSARTGAAYIAEIKTTQRMDTDIKELRACHEELVAEFTFPRTITSVVLSAVTEDGEVISVRRMRNAQAKADKKEQAA